MAKTFLRGDIVLVTIPYSDLSGVKLRPALVIESDQFVSTYADYLVATITSNTSRISATSVLVLAESESGRNAGLLQDSVILLDRMTNVLISTIRKKIGKLTDLASIDKALRFVLGL